MSSLVRDFPVEAKHLPPLVCPQSDGIDFEITRKSLFLSKAIFC